MESKFTVIRDTREQLNNGWTFSKADRCLGTKIEKLDTGDYSIQGLETKFTIERKANTSELAQNLYQDRFWKELDRLVKFEHPYLVLEFPFEYMECYPKMSGIPTHLFNKIALRGNGLIKLFHEMQLSYPSLRIAFVGSAGKTYTLSLFKRIVDLYQ